MEDFFVNVFNFNFHSTGNDHGAVLKIGENAVRQSAGQQGCLFLFFLFFTLKEKKVGIANYRAWPLWQYAS